MDLLSPSNMTTGIIKSGITESQVMLVLYEENKCKEITLYWLHLEETQPTSLFKISFMFAVAETRLSSWLVSYCLLDFF